MSLHFPMMMGTSFQGSTAMDHSEFYARYFHKNMPSNNDRQDTLPDSAWPTMLAFDGYIGKMMIEINE